MTATNALEALVASRKILVAIEAADRIDLFDLLAVAPGSTDALRDKLDVDADALSLLLRVLAWNGVLDDGEDGWRVSDAYAGLLDPRADGSAVHLLRIESWAAQDHLNAEGILAALRGARRPSEIPIQYVEALARAMLVGARSSAPHIARLPELRSRRSLADIGGGSGGYAVLLCRLHRGLSATVYDRAEMLRHAEPVIGAAGVEDRVSTRPFDLHSSQLPVGHDAALISHVLHLLSREERRSLLERVRRSLEPGGLVLVQDFVYDNPQAGSVPAASAVDWLAYGTAFAPSSAGLTEELEAVGLAVDRVVPRPDGVALVVARRA